MKNKLLTSMIPKTDNTMIKKYVVYAGYIVSKNDGQRHFITCDHLIRLYGVDRKECICVDNKDGSSFNGRDFTALIPLCPKEDGDYSLESVNYQH